MVFICLGGGESHNYGTDSICSCTYKYEGHADNCRGSWMTAMAWEILWLFGCTQNCSHYPSTNGSDDQLYPTNNKACTTNCSKAFSSKEIVKPCSLSSPPYRKEDYQCTAWVQHRVGASDTTHTSPHHNRGAMTTWWLCLLCHTRNWRGRGLLWQNKIASTPVMNLE